MAKKKLPVGIHTVATMIEENHLYVNKTAHIYKMIDEGIYYFWDWQPHPVVAVDFNGVDKVAAI